MLKSSKNNFICFSINSITKKVNRFFETVLKKNKITIASLFCLDCIKNNPGCHITELSEITGADRTTFSRVIEVPIKQGLVKFSENDVLSGDQRKKTLKLTEEGEKVLEKGMNALEEKQNEFFEKIKNYKIDKNNLHSFLNQFDDILKK